MAKQLAFYFNASACTGCHVCQALPCQDKNGLPFATRWRRVYQYGGGGWIPDPNDKTLMLPNDVFVTTVSTACMHCQDPICLKVSCPAEAISNRDDGVVLIDQYPSV